MVWRKFLVIFMLFALILQTAAATFIVLRFEWQRKHIAQTSCVQRKIKNNACKGACQLKRLLAQEEKREHDLMLASDTRYEAVPAVLAVKLSPVSGVSLPSMRVDLYFEICSGFRLELLRPPAVC